MRVWGFVQQKGGVGKSTLCLNLAVAAEAHKEKVLVVDLDDQRSAVFWSETRGTNKPTVHGALPEKLPDVIRAAKDLGATLVMIDAPSRLDAVALVAIRESEMIICPTLPDLLNLKPLSDTVALIETAGKLGVTVGVINNVDEKGAEQRIADATLVLETHRMTVSPKAILHLPAFATAYDEGKGVTEVTRAKKAAEGIQALWAFLDAHAHRLAAPRRNGKEARP